MEEWAYEFKVEIKTLLNNTYEYCVEADTPNDAIEVAIEFFEDDHPEEVYTSRRVLKQKEVR